jgi:multiple sugar transport system substrate-binding protein/raffinose/stachyose/melibiose transport system substrate-binding protein
MGATLGAAILAASMPLSSSPALAADSEMTISHYFTGNVGLDGIKAFFDEFKKETGTTVVDSPIGHEDFKTGILVRAAADKLPDVFSYWAGARTQFVESAGKLAPIDDVWASANLDSVVVKPVADAATIYDGKRYLVPIGYHYAGIFYNPKVMKDAGIETMPKTWDDLLAACKTLKAKGVDAIAIGSKNRWPAQFWFDYILLGTAGPQYRADLMSGKASYTDPQVKKAMELWKGLVDGGCIAANSNANDWTDAADLVSRGDAAMTLMGTWITGYWTDAGLKPVTDYDVFPFPVIDPSVPVSVVGPVDGFVMAKNAAHPDAARAFLKLIIGNVPLQANWAKIQGALSPNVNVDASIYTPVQIKALGYVKAAGTYAFNYDLATPPPVAEVGLNMFAKFLNDSSNIDALLAETQAGAADAFKKQ